jgi:hypothetical protein
MVCDGLFSVELHNCSTEKCFDARKSSFGGSVVFVDIDEPFFILVKARIADYKDYICTFELNGCNLDLLYMVFAVRASSCVECLIQMVLAYVPCVLHHRLILGKRDRTVKTR